MNSFGSSHLVASPEHNAGAKELPQRGKAHLNPGGYEGSGFHPCPESELMMDTIEALGATPVPTAFKGSIFRASDW